MHETVRGLAYWLASPVPYHGRGVRGQEDEHPLSLAHAREHNTTKVSG